MKKFKIPYAFLPFGLLEKGSRTFLGASQGLLSLFPFLPLNLKQSGLRIKPKNFLAMCLFSSLMFFFFLLIISAVVLFALQLGFAIIFAVVIAFMFSGFVFIQQVSYPKLISRKKIRSLEKNLLPALQNMQVQLNSGIPLFNILANIAAANYGELSKEFDKAIKEISAAREETDALEEIASNNPSVLFRRAIWQIVNGMKTGSDMSSVIGDIIDSLSEQQLIQIQNYGGSLNPLSMFYMLLAVIVPSLSITFIIVLSSLMSFSEFATKLIFWSLFVTIAFVQIMFLGIIKSRRPNLL